MLLQTTVYDRVANLLEDMCNANNWKQELFCNLNMNQNEHVSIIGIVKSQKEWVQSIHALANAVLPVTKKMHNNWYGERSEGVTAVNKIGNLMLSVQKQTMMGSYGMMVTNLIQASVGLYALINAESWEGGLDQQNLYKLLLYVNVHDLADTLAKINLQAAIRFARERLLH